MLNAILQASRSTLPSDVVQVDVRLGPASETLDRLAAEGKRFDLAFLDADKTGYLGYYKKVGICLHSMFQLDHVRWSAAFSCSCFLMSHRVQDQSQTQQNSCSVCSLWTTTSLFLLEPSLWTIRS